MEQLYTDALELLKSLIATPSLSREEEGTALLIQGYFQNKEIKSYRTKNNIWAVNKNFDPKKPSLLLNSHHDTVKPNKGYNNDPFSPIQKDGKLFGLGSNDAGGCLVSLIAAFVHFYTLELPYNLILAATAEEEISGKGGIAHLLEKLPPLELAIVGEPTLLKMAVAEKGLMVIDATTKGKAGHAAREEGINALYLALDDLLLIRDFKFEKVSEYLGENKVSATVIQAGSQHNVVPDTCTFTLDVRVTDAYTLEETLEELKSKLKAELVPRSMRLQSSRIDRQHKIIHVAEALGIDLFGSPTLSDQALIPYPSVKIGPGDSARSHTADEFIYQDEIRQGIASYIQLLEKYFSL
ncbi:M20 family metallo-hydrolase [Pleomorphovibrio marinus]|uniref:M20 family metallo-hydrolase n=1 Tax=Pleomorphovibrio marinus TaxID=2164132 RepID=UPI000E0C7356|nr:M20 family metallo-hydrolase [Pleomorphovibrio marinus]